METTEIIAELRKHGLSNGGSLGWHSGLCDEAADRLEELSEAVKQAEAQIDKLLAELIDREPVVHAHWIRLEPYGDARGRTHRCSKCEKHGYKDGDRCPGCGAHMDEKVYEPTPIGKLLFSMRVYKRLKSAGILTMEQLAETDKHTLHNIEGLGKQSVLEIEEKLAEWQKDREKNG